VRPGDENRVFYRLSVPKKVLVMLGGPAMNLVIAAVVATITLSGVGLPMLTPLVSSVTECVVPARVLEERVAAGEDPDACRAGDAASPAAEAGLRPGDRIVAVAGEPTSHLSPWADVTEVVRASAGEPVALTVEREGVRRELTVTPVATERPAPDGTGYETVGFLGVGPTAEQVTVPVTAVPAFLWDATTRTAAAIVGIPQRMVGIWNAAFSGEERDRNGPIGIVGVSRLGGEVAALEEESLRWRASTFLLLVASLNLALFVFNLIPLLPLDGGHIAGALYEGARRQVARLRRVPDPGPVDVARMLPVAYTVALLLVGMSALLLYADIVNPVRLRG
jgi:membrane-associated protease RseP (regulator of RpoE activity)